MPYFIGHVLELPLTTAQDYTVFHVLGDYSTTAVAGADRPDPRPRTA